MGAESKDPEDISFAMPLQGVLTMQVGLGSSREILTSSSSRNLVSTAADVTILRGPPYRGDNDSLREELNKPLRALCVLCGKEFYFVAEVSPGAGYVGNFSRVRFAR